LGPPGVAKFATLAWYCANVGCWRRRRRRRRPPSDQPVDQLVARDDDARIRVEVVGAKVEAQVVLECPPSTPAVLADDPAAASIRSFQSRK